MVTETTFAPMVSEVPTGVRGQPVDGEKSLLELVEFMRNPDLELTAQIVDIRRMAKVDQRKAKEDLPAYMVAGVFPSGRRKENDMIEPNMVLSYDFDKFEDGQDLKEAISLFQSLDCAVYTVLSASGAGFHAGIHFTGEHAGTKSLCMNHIYSAYWRAGNEWLKEQGVVPNNSDSTSQNANRIHFMSYDSNAWVNYNPEVLELTPVFKTFEEKMTEAETSAEANDSSQGSGPYSDTVPYEVRLGWLKNGWKYLPLHDNPNDANSFEFVFFGLHQLGLKDEAEGYRIQHKGTRAQEAARANRAPNRYGDNVVLNSLLQRMANSGWVDPRKKGKGRPESESTKKRKQAILDFGLVEQNGKVANNSLVNAKMVIQSMGLIFTWDRLQQVTVKDGKPFNDADIGNLRMDIEEKYIDAVYVPPAATVYDAVQILAHENEYHPILDTLPVWDGVDRLSSLAKVFGADDTPFHNNVLKTMVTAAVARQISPGIEFPYVPILYSHKQGVGKSRSLEILSFGNKVEGLPFGEFGFQKRMIEKMQGNVIIEIGEINSIGGKGLSQAKNIITDKLLRERMSYARVADTHPVDVIMVGTTNNKDILTDDQNRRFPIVNITGTVDLELLQSDMHQMWAQVKQEYKPGEKVVMDEALWPEIDKVAENYRSKGFFDIWVEEWLETHYSIHKDHISTKTLMRIAKDEHIQAHAREVSRAMNRLGWERKTYQWRDEGRNRKVWGYINRNPDAQPSKKMVMDGPVFDPMS